MRWRSEVLGQNVTENDGDNGGEGIMVGISSGMLRDYIELVCSNHHAD